MAGVLKPIADSWLNTPWLSGQRRKGGGVDCVNLCIGIWDEMTGKRSPIFANYFYPGSYETIDRAVACNVKQLMDTHRVSEVDLSADEIELAPADMLITRPQANGGPAHVLLLGTSLRECYHTERRRGVQITSCPPATDIIRVLRKRTF